MGEMFLMICTLSSHTSCTHVSYILYLVPSQHGLGPLLLSSSLRETSMWTRIDAQRHEPKQSSSIIRPSLIQALFIIIS